MTFLNNEVKKLVVKGLLKGEKEYLKVRTDAKNAYRVSAAFAWTRGNIVDSKVADQLKSVKEIKSESDKAGYTWEYLRFESINNDVFIVKNVRSLDKYKGKRFKSSNDDNYLKQYAEINNRFFDKHPEYNTDQQLELIEKINLPSVDNFTPSKFKRFYIITYELDDSGIISEIHLAMPKPQDNKFKINNVENLSSLMNEDDIKVELTPEERTTAENITNEIPEGQFEETLYSVRNKEEQNDKENDEK